MVTGANEWRSRTATRWRLGACLVATVILGGCATDGGIDLRGGQTAKQLEEDRAKCLPFVQAHPETTADLAEAACLVARGYRAPVTFAQGPARIGYLYATSRGEAPTIVADFQGCQVEAFKAPVPVIPDTNTSGIFSNFFSKLFPRGFTSKPPTPDDWAFKAFAACLTRRGYTVTDVTRLK
ncbi:MAG TPA: hypothetical protein VGA90_03120 [Methylomirabilota bacterium]